MRIFCLTLAVMVAILPAGGSASAATPDGAEAVAAEAVAEALTMPAGFKRDQVLRAVSRNLRWFGHQQAGERAARAMTDGGVAELPPGTRPGPPRLVPLREAMPTGHHCDAGLWRMESGGEAKRPKDREKWAVECLLMRDFHYIGRPQAEELRAAIEGLRPSDIKGAVIATLIRFYPDEATLRFASAAIERDGTSMPAETRGRLAQILAEPAIRYQLGQREEALAAAQAANDFQRRRQLIHLLLANNDAPGAIRVFEMLVSSPPDEDSKSCFDWFNPVTGLRLGDIERRREGIVALGDFVDRLPASAFFRRICPHGLDAELEVEYLMIAGRHDAAIARARREPKDPFLRIKTLLEAGETRLRDGDRVKARAHAMEAASVLPPFDLGDRFDPAPVTATSDGRGAITVPESSTLDRPQVITVTIGRATGNEPKRNFGERSGDTSRRLEVIRLLAASGATTEADALARKQAAGGLRAVALSAAVAGRAGLSLQWRSLNAISADDIRP